MNVIRKSISATGMLILLGLPGFLILHYQVMQLHIQHQMEEKLEEMYIQTVRVPVNEIQWYKQDKEIIIEGKLFDIKSLSIVNRVAEFKGLFDEKETSIKEMINQLQQQQEKNNPINSTAAKFFSLVLFQDDLLPYSFPCCLFPPSVYNSCVDDPLIYTNLSTPTPPPKI